MLAYEWEGQLRAGERLAIDSYPVEELERAVSNRFPPSIPERLALSLREGIESLRRRR